jgi:hypothetical protein
MLIERRDVKVALMNPYMFRLVRLGQILEAPPEVRLKTHLSELEALVDALRPEDFAVYGRDLCHVLIDIARLKRIQFITVDKPPEITAPEGREESARPPPKPTASNPKAPYYSEYPSWML